MEDIPQDTSDLRLRFEVLNSEYNGNVELSLAAEYMLGSGFNKHLKSGELLCLFDNYVLVEMSYTVAIVDYISIISEIMSRGRLGKSHTGLIKNINNKNSSLL